MKKAQTKKPKPARKPERQTVPFNDALKKVWAAKPKKK